MNDDHQISTKLYRYLKTNHRRKNYHCLYVLQMTPMQGGPQLKESISTSIVYYIMTNNVVNTRTRVCVGRRYTSTITM